MYSAVLMLALTAGTDAVDFGNRCNRNSGCAGYAGCSTVGSGYGSYGGCSSSYGGCATRGHHNNNYGCTSGGTGGVVYSAPAVVCSSSYGCSSSNGCCASSRGHGGLFSRLRNRCNSSCNGSGYVGCVSSSGYTGCVSGTGCGGGVIVVPATTPKTMPGETVPTPKKVMSQVPATIVVSLPADASLSVDGTMTTSTSDRRVFQTPNLEVGTSYVYTMRADVVRDGQTVSETREVRVTGGTTANVQFQFANGVASR